MSIQNEWINEFSELGKDVMNMNDLVMAKRVSVNVKFDEEFSTQPKKGISSYCTSEVSSIASP